MPRLELPLLYRQLRATGAILLRAELDFLLKSNSGVWQHQSFLFDSGTEMTTMPASLARQLDLPLPRSRVPGLTHAQTGLEVRDGFLRVKVVGMGETEFILPCFFLGDPSGPPPVSLRNLLGLSGVVDKFHIGFDGTPSLRAPYGVLLIETT